MRSEPDDVAARTALRTVVAALVIATFAAAVGVLVVAHGVALAFFGAIVLGEALRPVVDRLSPRLGRPGAIAATFVLALAVAGVVWSIPVGTLAPQIGAFARAIPAVLVTLGAMAPSFNLEDALKTLAPALERLIGVEAGFAAFIGDGMVLLLMTLFWLTSSDELRRFALSLIPERGREDADALFGEVGTKLGGYVTGVLINGAIVAAATGALLWAIGMPYPFVLGLLQGLLVAIPYLGSLIAVLTVGAVVLVAQGWLRAVEAIAVVSIAESLIGSFVSPLIYQRRAAVDPLATIVATAVGGALFGIGGVVLAVPAAIVLQALVVRVVAPALRQR